MPLPYDDETMLIATWLVGCWLLFRAFPQGRRLLRRWIRLVRRSRPRPFVGQAWIVDGDTLDVGQARVRLFDIDAPELSQRGGYKARAHLIRLAGGREVSVSPVDVDCYGRIVARVRCGETDLSRRMVEDGFARAMTAWHLDYTLSERRARRRRRGLWSDDPNGGIGDPAAHRRATARRAPVRR